MFVKNDVREEWRSPGAVYRDRLPKVFGIFGRAMRFILRLPPFAAPLTAVSAASSTALCRAKGSSAMARSTAVSRLISSRRRAASSNSRSGGVLHLLFQRRKVRAQISADEFARFLGESGIDRDMVLLIDRAHDVGDVLLDAGRRDAVRLVIGLLLDAAAVGLVHRPLHRAGHGIGV